MEGILNTAEPFIVEIAGAVLAAAISWAAIWAKSHFQASTVKLLQDVFQKGLEQAAGFSLNQIDPIEIEKGLSPSHPGVQAGVDYLKKAVPETIEKLEKKLPPGAKLNPFTLGEKIIAKMMVLTANQPAAK